ncbi:MAG: M4 family metallopeptidase [Ginsengibacter sp.]
MKSKIIQLRYVAIAAVGIMLLSALSGSVKAQRTLPTPLKLNPKLEALAMPRSTPNWLDFRQGTSINPTTIFTDLKDAFELKGEDKMRVNKTIKDKLGFTHYRYQQYYKNLKVVYGEYAVHQEGNGFVRSANGRLINGLNLGNVPSFNEKSALDAALRFMNAGKYLWQNPEMEKELKRQEKNDNTSYYPKGELVYAPNNAEAEFSGSDYRLAWQFKIYTDDPKVVAKAVYVDALTGKVIHSTDIAMNCSGGTGTSAFNGNVPINTELSGGVYRSHNNCQATDIFVFNCNGGGASNTYYTDADNTWTQQSAVQAQWGAQMTYSYYSGEHGRASWDGSSGDMIAYNNAFAGSNNACWGCTGNSTIFYAGNTSAATDDWNTNDIMGHEFTHGVTQDEAGLVYNKESGALNESFSDIFGEMVESWSEGNCDYLVGGDRGAIRSFINPNAYGDPDTYRGTNWVSTIGCTPSSSNDQCGVHTNSSVQNRWFYLLSEGGSGTNDYGWAYNVTGITRFKARLIAYRALTLYLNSTSQFIDARAASLHAALDLYGQCSPEIIAVGDAWHAVGVEWQSAQYVNEACGTYSNGQFVQAISQLNAANGCITTVNSPTNIVYFTARDRVILFPGFRAVSGARFIAYLEPCSSTMWRPSGSDGYEVIMSDAEKGIKNPVTLQIDPEAKSEDISVTDGVSIAPNPFHSSFVLSINSKENTKAMVSVYNALGVKVKEVPGINLIKGLNKVPLNGSTLVNGVYLVEVHMGSLKTVKKIVKL